jgi:hypothetical protein
MVAPALLCGSLMGSLPVVTVVAFFAATVFKNTKQEEPRPALQHPTLEEAAPFLLFLFLLAIDVIMRVTHDRQVCCMLAYLWFTPPCQRGVMHCNSKHRRAAQLTGEQIHQYQISAAGSAAEPRAAGSSGGCQTLQR